MKELTIEEKAKAYDEALKVLHKYDGANIMFSQSLKEEMFPELKKSEDERIKNLIYCLIRDRNDIRKLLENNGILVEEALTWIEKQNSICLLDNSESNVKFPFKARVKSNGKIVTIQGGQLSMDCKKYGKYQSNVEDGYMVYKPEDLELVCDIEQEFDDKVEPKFHEGDWVFIEEIKGYKQGPFKIKSISKHGYCFDEDRVMPFSTDHLMSLWTIKNAKEGDVLADEYGIYIFNNFFDSLDDKLFICKCAYEYSKKEFEIGGMLCSKTDVYPASKEQCDLLYQKIKEAGYEWDAEKKELSKCICFTKTMTSEKVSSAWSKEDDIYIENIILAVEKQYPTAAKDIVDWLKSLKNRINNF